VIVLDSARQWWGVRSPRERWMLGGLAVVLTGVVGWYGVVAPAGTLADWASARRTEAASDLAMVETAARAPAGPVAAPAAGKSLAAVVTDAAGPAGVQVERHREDAGGRVTVWVSAVEPRVLMQWITALRTGQGVAVVGMTATKADAAALEVEVSFARGGA
jgi:general secretion pathway protein M